MKSWGFSRMRKQWIPGHFSLLPRGLGTRLGEGVLHHIGMCEEENAQMWVNEEEEGVHVGK